MPATRLTATFDVTGWDAAPDSVFPHHSGEAPMTRVAVRKTFRGDLDGESAGEALLCQSADGATTPGGGYVVSERVRGTLAGREGSFVMQHGGIAGAVHPGAHQRLHHGGPAHLVVVGADDALLRGDVGVGEEQHDQVTR